MPNRVEATTPTVMIVPKKSGRMAKEKCNHAPWRIGGEGRCAGQNAAAQFAQATISSASK
jgi:hypothetical protein